MTYGKLLYLIEILHQTTTCQVLVRVVRCCILSKFYIKPQLFCRFYDRCSGCILSKFYIKPQLSALRALRLRCCILSKFYIKPQHLDIKTGIDYVVSYRNSTSNHNLSAITIVFLRLYLIEILHQTTTEPFPEECFWCCILSKFYIKPQLNPQLLVIFLSCILSKFYIKPQRRPVILIIFPVVSYRNSTSNHNHSRINMMVFEVVSYRNSTSNHNSPGCVNVGLEVVSYRNSTSNHNEPGPGTP